MASDSVGSADRTTPRDDAVARPIQKRDASTASLSLPDSRTSAAGGTVAAGTVAAGTAAGGTVAGGTPDGTFRPLVIGIAGGSGSGKSTVARKVAEALSWASVACIDMDAYYRNHAYLPMEERKQVNWDHPDAFDLELLLEHLDSLAARQAVEKPVYDFGTHTRSEASKRVAPADVVVIEGILLFVDERIRTRCDVKVFVDADADIRLIRRLRRDVMKRGRTLDDVITQYLETVQPMHLQFVEPSKRYADVIVPRGGHNAIAIEMIVAKIQRRLQTSSP